MSSLHHRAKELFLTALARPASERAALLAEACGTDADLRREVESLLTFHDEEEHTDPPVAPPADPFAAGEIIAGRYRMVARIGRGGMGDVWRADDLVLQTAVAVKVIKATGPDARTRILNEVRVARQITHPSVCRVFDVGEADNGVVFYTMELVRGENLATLLRRVGRFPSEKVVDIAHQLCAGLAAAHAQGVLHRDLKPANVLIDDEGAVRVTDFGIALQRSDAGMHHLTGTPGYMAPEQRAAGTTLSERTDIYALGVVLYELLAGRHPFTSESRTLPPRPSTFVPNVDPQLERVIMQSIAPDPEDRPASAQAMAAQLPAAAWSSGAAAWRPVRAQRWMVAAAIAAVVAVAGVASSYLLTTRAAALTAQDTIVLADFENTTGEPVFDGALKVALAVALEQSPFLKVFPDDRARETLRLMQRPPDERVTESLAREIARREQFKALIAGSIASLGRNYVLTVQAINADSGDVMAREQVEAAGKEQVLTSLGAAASKIREKLGESLGSIQKFDVPLPRATTQSLDALHAYSLALSQGAAVPRREAIPHLERAIELDPTFAMAYAFLSSVYANTGQTALAPTFARKAYALRDRVSERERFFISWRYHRDATQAWDKALDLARQWTATYPREASAFNSLGVVYLRLGRFDEAVAPLRQSIVLDPRFTPAYANVAAALMALDRRGEARAMLRQMSERRLEFAGASRLSYVVAFVDGDAATMARELAASEGNAGGNDTAGWQGRTMAFGGRVAAAHQQFTRAMQTSLQATLAEPAAMWALEDAEMHAVVGACGEARREAAQGLELSRDNAALEHASRTLAVCGAGGEATILANELARRFPDATLIRQIAIPIVTAAVAVERGDWTRAIEVLEPVRAYEHASSGNFWPAYLRGRAYLALGDAARARTEFEGILARRGEVPEGVLYPLAAVGLAHAATMTGDLSHARSAYQTFFTLWKDADADLKVLADARREYAQLSPSTSTD
jgi:Tfp pilus assembly protein PilF